MSSDVTSDSKGKWGQTKTQLSFAISSDSDVVGYESSKGVLMQKAVGKNFAK